MNPEGKKDLDTILTSSAPSPLENWIKEVKNGHVKRVKDEEISDSVIELHGYPDNVYIACPPKPGKSLHITKKWFCAQFKPFPSKPIMFQIQCLDSSGIQRVFRFDSRLHSAKNKYFFTSIPLGVRAGWNSIEVDLKTVMRRCYGTDFSEVTRVHVHAACRLRRVYFCNMFLNEESLPEDFRLHFPMQQNSHPPSSQPESKACVEVSNS